jgi:hypothetical protein
VSWDATSTGPYSSGTSRADKPAVANSRNVAQVPLAGASTWK